MYAFFLAAAAEMLKPDGGLVAITPRSFCNGLYFREFRQWFLERMALDHVHLFESRKDTFHEVLQESLITSSHRLGQHSERVTVSMSYGLEVNGAASRSLPTSAIVDEESGQSIIRIPANEEDSRIAAIVEAWPERFSGSGLRVSTGPVVMFRATEFLVHERNQAGTVPLLSVFNVCRFKTDWSAPKGKHPLAFRVCSDSMKLLLPAQNYVLLRRFSAKEEKRRLTACCLLARDVPDSFIALENHLNYVCHADRELSEDEVYGVTALFNSTLLDRYGRILSGNTQVNAAELRAMKFPRLTVVRKIGRRIRALSAIDDIGVESAVLQELGIGGRIPQHLLDT